MSTYSESSYAKHIVETRRKSKIDDESSSSDESSMPLIGMEIGTIAHIEQLMSFLELPEDYEIACDDTDFTYPCITTYLQDRRWRQQDLEALHKMHDFVDEIDLCGELEYDFEDFPIRMKMMKVVAVMTCRTPSASQDPDSVREALQLDLRMTNYCRIVT